LSQCNFERTVVCKVEDCVQDIFEGSQLLSSGFGHGKEGPEGGLEIPGSTPGTPNSRLQKLQNSKTPKLQNSKFLFQGTTKLG
jgi:hypothetical protein